MRHFSHLPPAQRECLFSHLPVDVTADSPRMEVAQVLGATLYVPANRPDLAMTVTKQAARGTSSIVVCLEDAVPDSELDQARRNTVLMLHELRADTKRHYAPLLFLRVRSLEDAAFLLKADLGQVLSGVAIPKFDPNNGKVWLDLISAFRADRDRPLYAMPILESPHLIDPHGRGAWIHDVHRLIDEYPGLTLALRIGTTDIAGAGGLRRSRDLTIYSMAVVRDVIASIIAEFILAKDAVPVMTAGVWEHYPQSARWGRPQLRQTLFAERGREHLREELVAMGLDKLAEEIQLDLANGLRGKTVIHPSHVALVNSLHTVEHEAFTDAEVILSCDGAHASKSGNKMNESKPHRVWASEVLVRARAFGVLAPHVSWVDVLGADMDASRGSKVTAR